MESAPPQAYFVVSAVFHYLGPAFAVLLFARVEPLGVAWLRIASAGAVFAALAQAVARAPRLDASDRRLLLALGAVFAVMNSCFYLAIDRLPLGTVAAIEFLPVIALAALGARTARNALALALAVAGVYLLTDVRLDGGAGRRRLRVRERGALRALHRARPTACRAARALGRIDGLAAAMLVALVVDHADRRLGGRAGARSIRSRSSPGSASASRRR